QRFVWGDMDSRFRGNDGLSAFFVLTIFSAFVLSACAGTPAPTSAPAPVLTMYAPAQTSSPTTQSSVSSPLPPTPSPLPPTPTPPPQPAIALKLFAGQVEIFKMLEMAIDSNVSAANPFDPAQADLRVRFTSPSGKNVVVPAFWSQDFTPDVVAQGAPGWRARFTPTEAGEWTAQAELAAPAIKSQPAKFSVTQAAAQGFVRVNKANPRYFAFDNGDLFLPAGPNMAWSTNSGIKAIEDYERWFDGLYRRGGNVARVWMTSDLFDLEWKDTGLGNYAKRLNRAFMLDKVFQLAQARGIKIILVLIPHGQFSTTSNPEWQNNPYNAANGGMLNAPQEFVSNAQARALFVRRVRYMAARWGYATNLLAWEWWNEVDLTPITDEQLRPWLAEMTAQIKQFDPNAHLITTSYAHRFSTTQIWAMPEISFAQVHDYSALDPSSVFADALKSIAAIAPNKPALVTEHGLETEASDALGRHPHDIHLRNGIWAAPFLGYAGTAMYWWWDNYFQPKDQWKAYAGFVTFMKGENLAAMTPGTAKATAKDATLVALTLSSKDRLLAWVRNTRYDGALALQAYAQAKQNGQANDAWRFDLPGIQGAVLQISGLADGEYTAHWFNTETNAEIGAAPVSVRGGAASIDIPGFTPDIAVKVTK
ncbi:MAG: DUF5060 domain-containing protein, partial [Anaerolineae bacterium]